MRNWIIKAEAMVLKASTAPQGPEGQALSSLFTSAGQQHLHMSSCETTFLNPGTF